MRRRLKSLIPLVAVLTSACGCLAVSVSGCGGASPASGGSNGIRVVAAENFWGSIASQLAGSRATVQSIIVDPATDPHSYEPRATDARALATAQLVIVNGLGYDPWAPTLLAANPVTGRAVLSVGDLLGLQPDANPHRWYSPTDVESVASGITAELSRLQPHDAAYFAGRLSAFKQQRLAGYHELIASIRARYAGVPVGASESIFALLSPALGLKLITPYSFMKSISEGTEVSARDTAATQQQLASHAVKVWVYNSQNATPQVQQLTDLARRAGIPIATVTETLAPPSASFEDWQAAQLRGIARALQQASGR